MPDTASSATSRLVWVGLLFFSSCFVATVSTAVSWYRAPLAQALPDVMFDVLPERVSLLGVPAHYVVDKLMDVVLGGTLGFACCSAHRLMIYIRVLCVASVLLLMRSVTLLLTSLPDPYPMCREMIPGTLAWSRMPWARILTSPASVVSSYITCGDMMFSGHTIVFVLCALVWHQYYPPRLTSATNPVKIAAWTVCGGCLCVLIVSRMHYTIDVVVAVYLSVTVWVSYHHMVHQVHAGHRFRQVFILDGMVVYPLIGWLETGRPVREFMTLA